MRRLIVLCALSAALLGCPPVVTLDEALENLDAGVTGAVDTIQTEDPRFIDLPVGLVENDDEIILDSSAEVIVDVATDIPADALPDITLLGFENLTGFDIFVRYAVNDVLQGILVFDGETLLVDYFCLDSVELLSEDDFDPVTGLFVDGFDYTNGLFLNPEDFICGDALIFTFDPLDVTASLELIDPGF